MRTARRVPFRRRPKTAAPYIVDTVNRAASTTSMGVADTGQTYTSETTAIGGVSAAGALYMVNLNGSTGGLFSLPYALPDVDFTATFVRPSSGSTGIAARVTDASSRISVYVDATANELCIGTVEGGTNTRRAFISFPTSIVLPNDPMTLRLLIKGTAVSLFLNGATTATVAYTLVGSQITGITGTNIALRQTIAGAGNGSFEGIRVLDPNGSSPGVVVAPGGPDAITQPPVGNEPGWTLLTREGFDTAFARGGFRAAVPQMTTMENVRGTNGTAYYRDSIAYCEGSELVMDLGWYDGTDGGLAEYRGFYFLPTKYTAGTDGRVDFRIRMPEQLSGWKAILIAYDNDNNWARGELDPFETGSIGGGFKMYTHVVGRPQDNAYADENVKFPGTSTSVTTKNYLTISGRWTPTEISSWVNGQKASATTNPAGLPTFPLSWRIGFEWSSLNANVPPSTKGRAKVYIDWVNTYRLNLDTLPQAQVVPQRPLTVTAGAFKAGGTTIRLSGANFYDAITSDAGSSPGNLEATPGATRRTTLNELREIGANAVRAHTLFIGYGKTGTQMPTLGNYDEAVLVRCDEFLAECRVRNLYVMAPLTDSWNFYHGGAITFANMMLGGTRTDTQAQIEFCSNATVIAAFKAYVSTLMNRVNTVTGVAWKDDPTLAIIETANEAWQAPFQATTYAATGNVAWHAHIAAWLKSNWPGKLVADGFATSGSGATNRSYALGNPNFNVLGTHLYDEQRNNTTFVNEQANAARAAGQAYVVGEWDWRDVANGGPTVQNTAVTRQQFLTALDDNVAANGQFWWTPRVAGRTHNGAYQLYLDAPANADQTSAKAQLTQFAQNYKGTRPDYTVTPTVRRAL